MKVRAIIGSHKKFYEGAGPTERITVGIEIEGNYHELGSYYYGPYMNESDDEQRETMEKFAKECELLFLEANRKESGEGEG